MKPSQTVGTFKTGISRNGLGIVRLRWINAAKLRMNTVKYIQFILPSSGLVIARSDVISARANSMKDEISKGRFSPFWLFSM